MKRRLCFVIDVFRGADWFERETYDLYGCYSRSSECEGSSPTTGSKGIRFARNFPLPVSSRCATTASRNASSTRRLRLTQEFRSFDFPVALEGTDYVLPGDEKARRREGVVAHEADLKAVSGIRSRNNSPENKTFPILSGIADHRTKCRRSSRPAHDCVDGNGPARN